MGSLNSGSKNFVELEVSVIDYKRGDIFLRYCPMLDLMTFSDKQSELDNLFSETVDTFFEYETEKGTLHQTLKNFGLNLSTPERKPYKINLPSSLLSGQFISNKGFQVSLPC